MVISNDVYKKYVINDQKNLNGLAHPVKSGLILRARTIQVNPSRLHPNPDDEFSMESVGPNWGIVGDYEKQIRYNISQNLPVFDEPLIAVRLDKGGYMLLNGHHRWLAALSQRIKKVPVKVVNIIMEEDIYQVIKKSDRDMCVAIDFDEVLFSDNLPSSLEKISFPYSLIYKKNIRDYSALLVEEFQRMGADVWVYTGSYLSEQYMRGLFHVNGCKVDGIVNGLRAKGSKKLAALFHEKYKTIIHVDNETISIVNTTNKNYEILDINADDNEEWASAAVKSVKNFDMLSLQ